MAYMKGIKRIIMGYNLEFHLSCEMNFMADAKATEGSKQ
jgi:hypothetical protein